MSGHLDRGKQKKILQKLQEIAPNLTTEEDYDEMLGLFGNEHEFNRHLLDLASRGLITSGLIETATGHVCNICDLAIIR
ncbi:hypothetical protein ACSFCX_24100 [Yokenella regensburgei]|uniref:hypothetical protein n=1 Tax=Yokenella regensburgei TaxID=158877 RepID=UPI003ED85493